MTTRNRHVTARPTLVAASIVLALAGGCVPEVRRGPVELGAAGWDGTTLTVEVPSCNGDPAVTVLEETATQVRIEVVSTVRREGDDCLDGVRVGLAEPLGERAVVDLTSGRRLEVSLEQ